MDTNSNVDFAELMNEAQNTLTVLNTAKTLMTNFAVGEIPALLKVEEGLLPDAFTELSKKIGDFRSELEEIFTVRPTFREGQASLETFVNGIDAYLERLLNFNNDVKIDNPENENLILNFIEATNSFVESLDNAKEELNNEILLTTGKISQKETEDRIQAQTQLQNAIEAQVEIVNVEFGNATAAMSDIESQVKAARTSKTGDKLFINKIADAIKLINTAKLKATNAQSELKKLTSDISIISDADTQVLNIEGILEEASGAKIQAEGFANNALERKNKTALGSIERQYKWIIARTVKFTTAKTKADRILADANNIVTTEFVLCPKQIDAIENAIENILEVQNDLAIVVNDAQKIYDDSLVKMADADQLLADMQFEASNVDHLQKKINKAMRSASWNLARIRFIAGTPRNPREFCGWFGTVNVKQFRILSWETQNKRSIFGFGMLIGICLGAFNFGLLINDMKHNSTIAFVAGLCWFVILAALERLVVTSMDSFDAKAMMTEGQQDDDKKLTWKDYVVNFLKSKYAFVIVRFFMIFVMTFMVTKVVEINLFDSAVKEQLVQMKAENVQKVNKLRTARLAELNGQKDVAENAVQPFIKKCNDVVKPLKDEVTKARENTNQALENLRREIDGEAGGHGRGDKAIAATKRAIYKADSIELVKLEEQLSSKIAELPEYAAYIVARKKADAEIERLNLLIKSETERFDQQTAKTRSAANDGLNERYVALGRVEAENPIWSRVIMIILFILESLPVLGKLMLGKDEYVLAIKSARMAAEDRIKLAETQQQTKHLENMSVESTNVIPFMTLHHKNVEDIANAKSTHQMNILNSLAFTGTNFDSQLALVNERNNQLSELISAQLEAQSLNSQLEQIVTETRKDKKKRA
jgi:hypothetical protein